MERDPRSLPDVHHLLVVCAHPYDATFTMGATIGAFTDARTTVDVLCLTHGRRPDQVPGRRQARAQDLGEAARELGVREVTFFEHPAGDLGGAPLEHLTREIVTAADAADALLVVDARGPDAHPDHARTMHAAFEAAEVLDAPLYGWSVARPDGLDHTVMIEVDRDRQRTAIACHRGVAANDPVRERLRTHRGPRECLVVLRPGRARGTASTRRRLVRTSSHQ